MGTWGGPDFAPTPFHGVRQYARFALLSAEASSLQHPGAPQQGDQEPHRCFLVRPGVEESHRARAEPSGGSSPRWVARSGRSSWLVRRRPGTLDRPEPFWLQGAEDSECPLLLRLCTRGSVTLKSLELGTDVSRLPAPSSSRTPTLSVVFAHRDIRHTQRRRVATAVLLPDLWVPARQMARNFWLDCPCPWQWSSQGPIGKFSLLLVHFFPCLSLQLPRAPRQWEEIPLRVKIAWVGVSGLVVFCLAAKVLPHTRGVRIRPCEAPAPSQIVSGI